MIYIQAIWSRSISEAYSPFKNSLRRPIFTRTWNENRVCERLELPRSLIQITLLPTSFERAHGFRYFRHFALATMKKRRKRIVLMMMFTEYLTDFSSNKKGLPSIQFGNNEIIIIFHWLLTFSSEYEPLSAVFILTGFTCWGFNAKFGHQNSNKIVIFAEFFSFVFHFKPEQEYPVNSGLFRHGQALMQRLGILLGAARA